MPKWKAALTAIFGTLFAIGGFVILVNGNASDRGLALGTIFFFGACAVVGVMQLLPQTLAGNRARSAAMALASLAMAAGCFLMAPLARADGDMFVMYAAWTGAAFFGVGALVIAWSAIRST